MPAERAPRLLAISDRRLLGARSWSDWLAELADAGVDAVQVREKDLSDLELWRLAGELSTLSHRPPTLLLNARADIALASGFDGVHLPVVGLPAAALRRRFGAGPRIGCSTHSLEEVEAARRGGADYATFGPVWETPSKRSFGAPPGPPALSRAAAQGVPLLALGGVDGSRLAAARDAGAHGVAGIRVFHDRDTLARLAVAGRELGWI